MWNCSPPQLVHLIDAWREGAVPLGSVVVAEGCTVLDEQFRGGEVGEDDVEVCALGLYAEGQPVPVLVYGNELLHLVALGPDGGALLG